MCGPIIHSLLSDIDDETVCVLQLNPLYAVLSSAISFYLPCLAMLCIYYRLHRYARRQAESIKLTYKYSPKLTVAHRHEIATAKQVSVSARRDLQLGAGDDKSMAVEDRLNTDQLVATATATAGANPGQVRYKMSDHKAAITLGIIMGVFLLSWGPFFTVNLVVALFGPDSVPPLVFAVFTWLGYCNSTMNPVIYSIFNRQFRDAFSRVLRQVRHRVICCSNSGTAMSGVTDNSCCCCCSTRMNIRGPQYGAVLPATGLLVTSRSPTNRRAQTSNCSVENEATVNKQRMTTTLVGPDIQLRTTTFTASTRVGDSL